MSDECQEPIQERWISYLPLGGHHAVTGGDTKEEGIEGRKLFEGDNGVVGFSGGIHFG